MRPFSVGGIVLLVVGVLVLSIRSFTYFTTEQTTGPLGFFAWDVSQPHTVFFSPVVGVIALVAGVVLLSMSARSGQV